MNALNSQNKKLNINLRKSYAKFFSVFMVCCFCFASCAWQQEEEMSANDEYRAARYLELIEKVNSGRTYDTAFVGDSLTNMGDFENVFADKNCINLGIAGDTIRDCRSRIHLLQQSGAKKVFLLIGINSFIVDHDNFNIVLNSYEELIKEIQEACPDIEIHLESLLPVSVWHDSYINPAEMAVFNANMKQIAEKYGAEYIDIHTFYDVDGYMDRSLTTDGVHLTAAGYQDWYDTVAEYL